MTPKGDDPVNQAKDIQELLDHLRLTSVVLVGWSHGGFQVLAYLGQYGTDRLYAAVLVDSALGARFQRLQHGAAAKIPRTVSKGSGGGHPKFSFGGLFKKHPPKDFFHQLTDAAARTPTDIALALNEQRFPGRNLSTSLPTIRQVPLLYAVNP